MHNKLKRMLKKGLNAIGLWVTIDSPDVAELLSNVGFDWLVIDMEHSHLTISDVQNLVQVIDENNTTPIVRTAWNDPVLIKMVLDVGVHGVLVPWVNSREEAELAVKSVRYPPQGIRGYGPRRAAMYGLKLKEYLKTADQEVMVIPQIETAKAVDNLEEILSVEGIDAIFIGPYDLAASLGYLGNPSHPVVQEKIKLILDKSRTAGVPAGIFTSPEEAKRYIEMGFQLIAAGSDIGILANKCMEILRKLKNQ
ncbi:MAG: HpcH/HpaI aldolase/citrate lyase family protein [archaeon GB-1867-005]|nr:HpcH/HpaI aldolase/citrate lyase family protein [Candidatus Culexmicrobium cathedralense]